jgi:ABC-2 type transport system ATP-binding protein
MQLHSPVDIADAVIEVGVTTTFGRSLYSTNTSRLGALAPMRRGVNRYAMLLHDLPLAEGEYFVRTCLMLADGTEVHNVPNAGQFSMAGDGRSRGVVHLDADFEVLPA